MQFNEAVPEMKLTNVSSSSSKGFCCDAFAISVSLPPPKKNIEDTVLSILVQYIVKLLYCCNPYCRRITLLFLLLFLSSLSIFF